MQIYLALVPLFFLLLYYFPLHEYTTVPFSCWRMFRYFFSFFFFPLEEMLLWTFLGKVSWGFNFILEKKNQVETRDFL